MTILEKRTSQLTTILQAWNDLEKDDQEKSINFISEFILSASLLQKFSKDENLKTQLTLFQENYKKIFGVDITKLGTSDLSKESVEILKEIKKIDEKDLKLSTKREQTTLLLKSKGLNPKEFREKLIDKIRDKRIKKHSEENDSPYKDRNHH